jgi:hypothetical protein
MKKNKFEFIVSEIFPTGSFVFYSLEVGDLIYLICQNGLGVYYAIKLLMSIIIYITLFLCLRNTKKGISWGTSVGSGRTD